MKKFIVITRNMGSGGAERVIAQLTTYFTEKQVQCKIVTLEEGETFYPLAKGVERISIGRQSENKLTDKWKTYQIIRKLVKREKPDVVLSMPEEVGVYVLLALFGTKIPVYVSERNNPWVMPDVKITRILRKLMYPFAKGLIFQTEMAKSFFSRKNQAKGIVIPNPVDEKRIPQPWQGDRPPIIAGAGRLTEQKNFPLLIHAFAEFYRRHPDYKLVIYGEGAKREELEQLVRDLRLEEAVSLPGRKENLSELMCSAAMFVLSSDYEGMPNVLLEAMCMGMPVISTDCPSGGPKEVIEDGVNGLLVPVNDETAMAEAMEKMTDAGFARSLGEKAYEKKQELCSTAIFEKWETFLFRTEEKL